MGTCGIVPNCPHTCHLSCPQARLDALGGEVEARRERLMRIAEQQVLQVSRSYAWLNLCNVPRLVLCTYRHRWRAALLVCGCVTS